MKKIIVCLLLSLMFMNGISGIIAAQEVVMEHNVELSEEQEMLWRAYGINPNTIEGVWVHSFKGTPSEAILFLEESFKRGGIELPEMHKSEGNLSDVINNTTTVAGEQLVEVLGQDWIESAKDKAAELKDVKQISYITGFEHDGTQIQINIDSPYLSPITLEVYDGTYITQTEVAAEKEDKLNETLGEEVSLDSKLPIEYLLGEWTIMERELDSKYDKQVPSVTIKIEDYIGSIEESEIEAERFIFSGKIIIEGEVYEAYTEIDDNLNMYAYPIRLISVLKEAGVDPVFEIWFEDMDQNLAFSASSDFSWVYENALGVKLYYNVNGNDYDADFDGSDDDLDYIIKAN